MEEQRIRGRLVDIPARRFLPAEITIRDGHITAIREVSGPV